MEGKDFMRFVDALNAVSMPEETREQVLKALNDKTADSGEAEEKLPVEKEPVKDPDTAISCEGNGQEEERILPSDYALERFGESMNNVVAGLGQTRFGGPSGIVYNDADTKDRDFSGMTAEEIAREIDKSGFKVSEMASINAALDADLEKKEEEYRQEARKNWLKFRCHPVDVELGVAVTDMNNYDGDFYSYGRCEMEARKLLQKAYRDAEDIVDQVCLYEEALTEIMDFAEGRFEEERIRLEREGRKINITTVNQFFDLEKFRNEVEDKLQNIRIGNLKDFNTYFRMVEYDDVNGSNDGLEGFIGRLRIAWNFNGYDAYTALRKDAQAISNNYAKKATEIAKSSLRKRIDWLEELKMAV